MVQAPSTLTYTQVSNPQGPQVPTDDARIPVDIDPATQSAVDVKTEATKGEKW